MLSEPTGSLAASRALDASPPNRIRALFINDTSRNGGPGRTMLDILKFVDSRRFHRTVLVPRAGIVSERLQEANVLEELLIEPDFIENLFEPTGRALERRDLEAALPVKVARAAGNLARATRGLTHLLRRVRRDKFDVVFCNGTMANFIGGAIAASTRIPVVWHVLYPSVPRAVRGLHARLASSDNVRSIVCVSRATAGQFDFVAEKVRLIPDALDTETFRSQGVVPVLRKELNLDERTVIFGSHGRILRRKGFIELIQAARIVLDRLGDQSERCRFVVLGDTPEDLAPDHLAECRALVEELQLGDRVYFLGFREDVRPYLADFDVAIAPSVYEDPLPRSVMEAMAMSKPVIAFDVGGIGDMIDDDVEGKLIPGRPPDVEQLAEACLSYFRNEPMRRRAGEAARHRVERDFNAHTHAQLIQGELLQAIDSVR